MPHYLNDHMIKLQATFEFIEDQFRQQAKAGVVYTPMPHKMSDHEAAYRLLNGRGIACQ